MPRLTDEQKGLHCAQCGKLVGEKGWVCGNEDWCDACARSAMARQGWETRRRRQHATTDR